LPAIQKISHPLYFFIIIFANAISTGALALVARAVGEGDRDKALRAAKHSIIFSILAACCLTLPGLLFPGEIIAAAGFPDDIRPMAVSFLRIFSLALGPNYILIISNAVFRAVGEVRKPLFTMFFVSLINIVGDFVLVFGVAPFPALGYTGIAVSTASSVSVGMILNLFILSRGWWRQIYRRPCSPSPEAVRAIMRIGWPAAMLQIGWNAGYILLYNILARLGEGSITAIAALTAGLRIEAVIYLPAFALHMAASVLIGQNLGAAAPRRAEALGWRLAKAGLIIISIMSLVIFVMAERLAHLLTPDAAVVAEAARYLRYSMVSEPFMALGSVLSGGLQGAGDTRGTMWIIVSSMWIIRLPLAYVLALVLDYGAPGVWIAMVVSMVFQGLLMALRFRQGAWKAMKV